MLIISFVSTCLSANTRNTQRNTILLFCIPKNSCCVSLDGLQTDSVSLTWEKVLDYTCFCVSSASETFLVSAAIDIYLSYKERLRSGIVGIKKDDAVALFHSMIQSRPLPTIVDFSRLFSGIAKTKQHDLVLGLSKQG